jgi:hypothetical protein
VTDRPVLTRFDLSIHFTDDVIRNPGDEDEDAFDQSGHSLVVEGFDPFGNQDSSVSGLPVDQVIGIHHLGDYNEKNAIVLMADSRDAMTIKVPPGHYQEIAVLGASANGDVIVPIVLNFQHGATAETAIHCPDWFADPSPDNADQRWTPVRNGMDRALRDRIADRNDPALFEMRIGVSPQKVMESITLDAPNATFPDRASRFSLFSIVGISAED